MNSKRVVILRDVLKFEKLVIEYITGKIIFKTALTYLSGISRPALTKGTVKVTTISHERYTSLNDFCIVHTMRNLCAAKSVIRQRIC